jgi:hypothetical protein
MALCVPFRKALTSNSTSTGFTAQNTTTTEPSGTGVFNLLASSVGVGGGHKVPTHLMLMPFGTNGDNDTFDFRVYGYNKTNDSTPIYVPQLLVDCSVVLCAITATSIAADTFLADTITVNDGPPAGTVWQAVTSTAEDMASYVIIHTLGCQYIKFDWDLAGAQEAASMNCLWRPVSVD